MRISFDLDEVLFVNPQKYETEKPLRFPMNRLFPERLRKGTVRLIHELQKRGFEVWVYTSSYRTELYIRALFRNYGVRFDHIVNGARHQAEVQGKRKDPVPTKVPGFYHISLHIDDENSVIQNCRMSGVRAMRVFEPDSQWAEKILTEAVRIRRMEEQADKPGKEAR